MTCPCTSVSRRSVPLWRNVSFSWSIPSRCRIVAWRSWTSFAFDALPRPLVALAVRDAALDAGAGQPRHRRAAVVVAAVGPLAERLPAELGAPDDQRVVEQAALLEVARAARRSAGRSAAAIGGQLRLDVGVVVPVVGRRRRRRSRPARSARRARPAAGRSGTGGRRPRSPGRRGRRGRGRPSVSRDRSSTSGAASCIRAASS